MPAKYRGYCPACRKSIRKGERIWFVKGKPAIHASCKESPPEGISDIAIPSGSSPVRTEGTVNEFSVDWAELRNRISNFIETGKGAPKPAKNKRVWEDNLTGSREEWQGFSGRQLNGWLKQGFQTDSLKGLEEFNPPIREKRRLIFTEDGDEFHLDLALSGEEKYLSEWTKRESIPGVSLDIEIGSNAGVSAATVNAFNVWACKIAFSLETAGIDCEINVGYSCNGLFVEDSRQSRTLIRVKKENEATDFSAWSAMLSPAAFRGIMFAATAVHAEARNITCEYGLGRGINRQWRCFYDEADSKLKVQADFDGREFPEESMNAQFRNALAAIMRGFNE